MRDAKLEHNVAKVLGDEAEIIGAFVAVDGPRPGAEVFGLVLFAIALFTLGSVAAWVLLVAWQGFVLARRGYRCVVLTASEVALLSCGRMRWRTPKKVLTVRPVGRSVRVVDESAGDKRVLVGDQHHWVLGRDWDEARRVAGLVADMPG